MNYTTPIWRRSNRCQGIDHVGENQELAEGVGKRNFPAVLLECVSRIIAIVPALQNASDLHLDSWDPRLPRQPSCHNMANN